MKKKTYQIQGRELELKPLLLGQVRQMVKLMDDLNVDEETSFQDLVDEVLSRKLPAFMEIIFPEQGKAINWDQVDYETIDQIVSDFLLQNPRLIRRLKSLFGNLVQLVGTPTPLSKNTT